MDDKELIVSYKGKPKFRLNKSLFDQQNCWENLEEIKWLHIERLDIEETMTEALDGKFDLALIKHLDKEWTENQFALQEAWKFEKNAKFHRFWDIPACKCAKLDNLDSYPSGYYSYSGGCQIHAHRFMKEEE